MILLVSLIVLIVIFIWALARDAKSPKYISYSGKEGTSMMRCPTCGSPARVYGSQWECTWCSDFGTCASSGYTVTITFDDEKEKKDE